MGHRGNFIQKDPRGRRSVKNALELLPMETILREIIDELKSKGELDDKAVARILQKHNRAYAKSAHTEGIKSVEAQSSCPENAESSDIPESRTTNSPIANPNTQPRKYAKKHLIPYFLKVKNDCPETWAAWNLDAQQEEALLRALRMKPRRTASGVATITVLTKPWPCGSNCLYCPNDVRMPKSYLSDEPACQRAERNFFDPYLQVASRLRALEQMGHATDKVELIVLGGTWSDYPESYQIWFIHELFRALNDAEHVGSWNGAASEDRESLIERTMRERRAQYEAWGILSEREQLAGFARKTQEGVNSGEATYNKAVAELYDNAAWQAASATQTATLPQLQDEHRTNETARHRVVGLVVETRPDAVSPKTLTLMRQLGCTKVQMGIQSLDPALLRANTRGTSLDAVRKAFALLRLFGFKIHAHFMVNLLGATPESDKADYRTFVSEDAYLPDEVKLYPCVLVESAALAELHAQGTWQPYDEAELVNVLVADMLATPTYTRVSRMIRDISAHDIVAGNKKTNLRQMVEQQLAQLESERPGTVVNEIRYREIGTDGTDGDLRLDIVTYETTVSTEHFLQWVTSENKIAGFLRLSLPDEAALAEYGHGTSIGESGALPSESDGDENSHILPIRPSEAMIREVHVYGKAARLHASGDAHNGAQHLGLGKQLVETACRIAREHGYNAVNVISAVGTRAYYRSLGFSDNGLYQRKAL